MQKKIIALAIAAAFATPVVAMADVTVYGTMDGGIRHQTNDNPTQGTTDSMKMGQYNTARWGFKSVEDMGDGLKTNVVLETSLAPAGVGSNTDINPAGTGTTSATNPFGLIFDRQATIGLEGSWGKADMGWNYTTSFQVIQTYDPFNYKFLGVAGAKSSDTTDRAGSLQYKGKFGDVSMIAEYDINDAFQSRQPAYAGTARALGLIYASGAINVGLAYTAQEANLLNPANGNPVGYDDSMTHVTAGAGYNFGDGKVSVGYAKKDTKTPTNYAGDALSTNMWLGASFNMSSKMAITAAYYKNTSNSGQANANDSTKNTILAGVTYDLSKKTQVYFELDKATANAGGSATDVITSGSGIGISTAF